MPPPRESTEVCPQCERHLLTVPLLCLGRFNRENAGLWYQHCLRHTFKDNSPCRFFRWLDQDQQFLRVDLGVQDPDIVPYHTNVNPRRSRPRRPTMSSTPNAPPPPPPPLSTPASASTSSTSILTQSGYTLLSSVTPPKRARTDCANNDCKNPGAKDCSNNNLCKSCCRHVCLEKGNTCKSRRHKTNAGTTAPMADVTPQVIATLDGQPERTTFARNLPPALYHIVDHHNQIASLAESSDGASTRARREVDKTITISIWADNNQPSAELFTPHAPRFPIFHPSDEPRIASKVLDSEGYYTLYMPKERAWATQKHGFQVQKDAKYYLRHPSVTTCLSFPHADALLAHNTSTSLAAPSTPMRSRSFDFMTPQNQSSSSKRRADTSDLDDSPTKRHRSFIDLTSDSFTPTRLFATASSSRSAASMSRSHSVLSISTEAESFDRDIPDDSSPPPSPSSSVSRSLSQRPALSREANLLDVLSIKIQSAPDDLTQAPTEGGKSWPLQSLRDMIVGFQRMEAKVSKGDKAEAAFAAVFGTRKEWKRQTYNDHLNILKDIPRAAVEGMLELKSTWLDLRNAARRHRRK